MVITTMHKRNPSLNYFLTFLLIVAFTFGCTAQKKEPLIQNKNNHTLLWEISGNGLTELSYLYGTFHLLCKDDIHLSKQLKNALSQSKEVYLEMDMDDPATMLAGALTMNMKGGKKLSDFFSTTEYERIKQYFADSLKTPIAFFEKTKPFFITALLYPKYMDCKNVSSVEQEIMTAAKQQKKEIKGLETIQFQSSIVDSIPYEWQAKELLKSIDSFEVNKKQFAEMVKIYQSQNLDSMGLLLKSSDLGGDQYNDIFLKNRNLNWIKQLREIMKKESVFVAVGAGHLIGDFGLIELLKKAGYTVTPLENRKAD